MCSGKVDLCTLLALFAFFDCNLYIDDWRRREECELSLFYCLSSVECEEYYVILTNPIFR